MPLQFTYLKSCHYNPFIVWNMPPYTFFMLLDPHADQPIFILPKMPLSLSFSHITDVWAPLSLLPLLPLLVLVCTQPNSHGLRGRAAARQRRSQPCAHTTAGSARAYTGLAKVPRPCGPMILVAIVVHHHANVQPRSRSRLATNTTAPAREPSHSRSCSRAYPHR
jgi:hypothetical protein